VVLTHKGTVGRVGRAPADAPHFVCSPQTTFWRSLDYDQLDQAFLFAYLRSPLFAAQLRTRMHETDMAPYVSLTAQRSLSVLMPPIGEQRRIASVLRALDDKIDSNRRLRALLKEVEAIHFSHLRSEATSEQDAPLEDLAATIKRGITPTYSDDGLLVLNQRCVRDNTIAFYSARRHDDKERAVAEDRLLQAGDVLVNSTGVGTLGRVAHVTWLDEPATTDSHVTIIRPLADLIDPEFLAWDLMSRQSEIEALAEGTTGQTELSRKRLAALRVSIPDRAAQESFSSLAVPLREQRAVLEQEDLTLTGLRKDLLPKLISGKIRVPDTHDPEEAIGPAAERLAAATP
jgi:type I restriction enzyme S subunit